MKLRTLFAAQCRTAARPSASAQGNAKTPRDPLLDIRQKKQCRRALYKPVVEPVVEHGQEGRVLHADFYASVFEAMLGNWSCRRHGPNSYVIGNEMSKYIEVFATYAKRKASSRWMAPAITRSSSSRGHKFMDIAPLRGQLCTGGSAPHRQPDAAGRVC